MSVHYNSNSSSSPLNHLWYRKRIPTPIPTKTKVTFSASVRALLSAIIPITAAILLPLCSFASAATYNIGPGKTYTNIGDAPWNTLTAGDVVNIYPKTAITATTASSSTGTTISLTTTAGSIPYGSTVWFSGYTGIMPYVTCGAYGSGLYSTATGGTACSGNDVTISEAVSVGSGVTVYFTPPYFEKLVLAPAAFGTAESPIVIQGVPDPTTGALPILEAHHSTTGPNMAHAGSTAYHDAYGFILFAKNSGQTAWPKYLTLKKLRIQGGRGSLTGYDGTNASYTYASGAGIRFENAENVTIEENEFVDNSNGVFGATNPGVVPVQFITNLTMRGNHFFRNGSGSGSHQTYIESNGIVYEYNWYDKPGVGTSCSQLKDRSRGMVVRYNLFNPSARVLDLVAAQNSRDVNVDQVALTVPAGGFASGATSLTFGSSVANVHVGDRVGYVHNTAGWGYPGSGLPVMPTVSAVNTGTNTLTLDSPGLPASLSAGVTVNVISRQVNPYMQSFVYGNVIDFDQTLYGAQPGPIVHYGWDTAGGIDSVYDRGGTLYFYHNTIVARWDISGSTGASYGNTLFQPESEADTIRADNNLFYITNANAGNNPSYLQAVARAAYGQSLSTVGQFGGGKNFVVTSSGIGSNTCASITLNGWAACAYAPSAGSSIDLSNWTAVTATQAFPSGLTGRDYHLQAGSSAIGTATALPAAIASNTLGMDLTPTSQYGGTARTNLVDVGAYQYTEGTPDPPSTTGASIGSGAAIGGGVVVQ